MEQTRVILLHLFSVSTSLHRNLFPGSDALCKDGFGQSEKKSLSAVGWERQREREREIEREIERDGAIEIWSDRERGRERDGAIEREMERYRERDGAIEREMEQ